MGSLVAVALAAAVVPAEAAGTAVVMVSVASDGSAGDLNSDTPSVSADGRFVAFSSRAATLVPSDGNGHRDVFVRDTLNGTTRRVSVASDGSEANGSSGLFPAISADGRYVAFESSATNLVSDDTNGALDVFWHDTVTGETRRVSVRSDGSEVAIHGTGVPAISDDGRYVAFTSAAPDLVGGDTNGIRDVFVHDTVTGSTTRESVATGGIELNGGSEQPGLSADGRYVLFSSSASNLPGSGSSHDVYVRDRISDTTELVSAATPGIQGGGALGDISADGRFVVYVSSFSTTTDDFHDILHHDRATGVTTRAAVGFDGTTADGESGGPSVSDDGRLVAFYSDSTNLVPDDTNGAWDVFVRDVHDGLTHRVSVTGDGTEVALNSFRSALSADGTHVGFMSEAPDLVTGDLNGVDDVFLAHLASPSDPDPDDEDVDDDDDDDSDEDDDSEDDSDDDSDG